MEWKWSMTCEMEWKWREMEWKWSEIVEWNEFWNFSQMVHQTSLKFSEVVTNIIMHLPLKNLSHWLHGSPEKWEMAVGESGQFLEKYTLKFSEIFCVYSPYLNAFTTKISGPTDARFESYEKNQLLPYFTLHFAQFCNKKIRHGLILRPNWVIPMGNCVFLPSLLPHASRISFWWRKGAAVQKHSNLSYSVHNAENWKSAWKTLLKCP